MPIPMTRDLIWAMVDVENKAKDLQQAIAKLTNENNGQLSDARIRHMIDAAYRNRDGKTTGDGTLWLLVRDYLL